MRQHATRRDVIKGVVAGAATLSVSAPAFAETQAKTHTVLIKGFVYEPANLEVQVGDTIRWINEDLAPHTATADAFGWDTGELARGEHGEITVTEGMETTYFCVFHPHMKASITIG